MNHASLIRLGKSLGYGQLSERGICRGLSMMWVQAVCYGKLEDFEQRMLLLNNYVENPAALKSAVEALKKRLKNKQILTTPERQLLEIPAFFEGISLYQSPGLYQELFNTSLGQRDASRISEYTQAQTAEKQLLSKHTDGQYNTRECLAHLTALARALENMPAAAISLCSSDHCIALRYAGKGLFEFMDADLQKKTRDKETLAKALQEIFIHTVKDGVLVLSTEVFTLSSEQLEIFTFAEANLPIDTLKADARGITLLQLALERKDEALFRRINLKTADLNHLNIRKECALGYGCRKNSSLALLEKLLAAESININPEYSDFGLPLIVAILEGRLDIAEKLIAHPTLNPQAKDNKGLTGLQAIARDHRPAALRIARQLLDKKADLHARDINGNSALHFACFSGNTSMAALLLEYGADANDPTLLSSILYYPEILALFLQEEHFVLTPDQLRPEAAIRKTIAASCSRLQGYFLKKALQSCLRECKTSLFFNFWADSSSEKTAAARHLLQHLEDPENTPLNHAQLDALDANLFAIYQAYQTTQVLGLAMAPGC